MKTLILSFRAILMGTGFRCLAAVFALTVSVASLFGHALGDGGFEGRHTHSIGLTPDGARLLALNTADGRLSVFNVANAANPAPVLEMEIPVGIEPVSLRARTDDEVWVVNEVGDSVSVVSLSRRAVVETLRTPDEPADVVFAQGKAFVSCARSQVLRVFDAVTRQPLATIALQGVCPHALATDAAGTKIFAAFLLSGNGTTVLPADQAPAQPPPTNPALPAAPQTALIVAASDPRIGYTVLDHDVVEVDAATGLVTRYLSGAGTNLFDIAVQPGTGDLWVPNSEARNLVRFEPVLRGHLADHRLTRLDAASGAATIFDLNPGFDYALLPNPAAQAIALSQPTALVFSGDGTEAWVAAFGSDRVARVSAATGTVTARIDLRNSGDTTRQMRGPRALALHEGRQRLYVLNKIASSVSVIGTASGGVIAEVPVGSYDPTPVAVREGRGFLFDARLSGNGTIACATCHLDADLDGLAWDLGDPGGEMTTVMGANLSVHDPTLRPRTLHPMKGPMTTQTLRALIEGAPFHWRGDRGTVQSFNPTFDKLMGGVQLSQPDIDALAAYLITLQVHPNPFRNLDNTVPATVQGGNPVRGETLFNAPINHCAECHTNHSGGTNNIDLPQEVGASQPIKNPPLRTVYQRLSFFTQTGSSPLSGFGLLHDGTGFVLPTVHPYVLDQLSTPADFADVAAFILCFDTGQPPALGVSCTLTAQNATEAARLAVVEMLEYQSGYNICQVVVQGMIGGQPRSFYHKVGTLLYYEPDTTGETLLTRGTLLAMLGPNDALTYLGVPYRRGFRLGKDRDLNGILNRDEAKPSLAVSRLGTNARLQWPAQPAGWVLESATTLGGEWETVTQPRVSAGVSWQLDDPIASVPARFYRLRRTW